MYVKFPISSCSMQRAPPRQNRNETGLKLCNAPRPQVQNQVIKYSYPLAKRSETRIQPNAANSTCWILSSSFVNSSLKHQPMWQTNNTRAQLDWINSGIYVSGCQSVKQDNFSQSNLLFKTKANSHCQNFQLFTRYWSRPTYLPHKYTVITNLQWILRFGTSEY